MLLLFQPSIIHCYLLKTSTKNPEKFGTPTTPQMFGVGTVTVFIIRLEHLEMIDLLLL
jgi:hypothetical protein